MGGTSIGAGAGGSGAATETGSGSATGAGAGAAATGGFAVFTSRGGGSVGAAGFGGSGAFFAGAPFLPLAAAGVSAKMSPLGSWTFLCLASRSTNWRATTSSMVLDALFTSIP